MAGALPSIAGCRNDALWREWVLSLKVRIGSPTTGGRFPGLAFGKLSPDARAGGFSNAGRARGSARARDPP